MPERDPVLRDAPLVAVLGPTAVGKTALGIALAQANCGEIVSADSRQFYRLMDIGTAKATAAERAAAPHHLVDIADPDETVGLAPFLALARSAIHDIHARDRLPLVVGGTGQFVRALLEGWRVPNVPPDPALRAALKARAEDDPSGLWQELLARDPEAGDFIDPRNLRRVIRALEVSLKTGRPFSELRRRTPPPYRILSLGLTMDRDDLYRRADARVDRMIEAGLAGEVERLLGLGYGWDLPSMSGLGYAQFRPYFEAEADLASVIARIKQDTHVFIRRQYTWFRALGDRVNWLDTQSSGYQQRAQTLVAALLKGSATEVASGCAAGDVDR